MVGEPPVMDIGAPQVTGADITMDITMDIAMDIAMATGPDIMQVTGRAVAGPLTIIIRPGHQITYTRIVHRG